MASEKKRIIICTCLAMCLIGLGMPTSALAARYPISASLDGGTLWTPTGGTNGNATSNNGEPVVVMPGASFDVNYVVRLTSSWDSTSYTIEGGSLVCVNTSNESCSNCIKNQTISVTAPMTPGTYDLQLYAYSENGCGNPGSGSFDLANAIIVCRSGLPEVLDCHDGVVELDQFGQGVLHPRDVLPGMNPDCPAHFVCTLRYGLAANTSFDPKYVPGNPVEPFDCHDIGYTDGNGNANGVPIVVHCTDDTGDFRECEVRVTVVDRVAPLIKECALVEGDPVHGNDAGVCGANLTVIPPFVFDGCDLDPTITFDLYPPTPQDLYAPFNEQDPPLYGLPPSDANRVYGVGTTKLVWHVVDASGNESTCVLYVRVEDREPPTLTCTPPPMITLYGQDCEEWIHVPQPGPEDVSDNCKSDEGLLATLHNDYNHTNDASDTYPVNCNPGTTVNWHINDCAGKHRDIVLAIDISGSISSSELATEVNGLKACLANDLPHDGSQFIAIVAYATEVTRVLDLTPLNATTLTNDFYPALDGLSASGNTNIGGALAEARDILAGGLNGDVIVLIGDGNATAGPDVQTECADTAAANITICSIAIGDSQNVAELMQCADATGGQTFSAANVGEVQAACSDCFTGITEHDANEAWCSIDVCVKRPNPPLIKCGANICVGTTDRTNRGGGGEQSLGECSAWINFNDEGTPLNPYVSDACTPQGLVVTHRILSSPFGGVGSGTNGCGCFDDDDIDCETQGCSDSSCSECDGDATGTYPVGTTVIEWKVVNPATGFMSTCEQTVTVVDNESPYLQCNSDKRTVVTVDGCTQICPADIVAQLTDPESGPALECSDNCPSPTIFIVDGPAQEYCEQALSLSMGDSWAPVERTECYTTGQYLIAFACRDNALDCDGNPDPNYSNTCCIRVTVLPGPCVGACCFQDGSCQVLTQSDCAVGGGTYNGDNTSCDPNPCTPPPPPTGACCNSATGECAITTEAQCAGSYQGDGTTCDPNMCPAPPTGACCDPATGSCTITTEALCAGNYSGDDTVCDPNSCPPPPMGACCNPTTAQCTITTQAQCAGNYQGDNTTCDPNLCPKPTGACCLSSDCVTMSQTDCDSMGGSYQGDGTPCSPDPCSVGLVAPLTSENDQNTTNTQPVSGDPAGLSSGLFGGLCAPSNAVVLSMMFLGLVVVGSTVRRRRRR